MFERFTDAARRVVVHAQEEARLLDHGYIGTEHILLGLCREDTEGLAAAGVLLDRARAEVEDLVGRGRRMPPDEIPFTPRAKKVLELSLREALRLGHNYIGDEHILLGMIREGEGGGAKVLERLGVSFDDLRQRILAQLRSRQKRPVFPPSVGVEARLAAIEERLERIERLLRGRDSA